MVRRPAASTAPRKTRAKRTAERRSRAAARAENQWPWAGVVCENDMVGSVRGMVGVATAIVPDGPAFVYPRAAPVTTPMLENRGKCSYQCTQTLCTVDNGPSVKKQRFMCRGIL